LDKAPFSMETRGLDMLLSSCLPPPPTSHMKSLSFFPWQTGGMGLGGLPSHLQSYRAEGIAWVSGGS
jgi:hypothetical protein